jgi:hypothetical protein
MEAGAHALGQLLGDMQAVAPLFDAFAGFVAEQAERVPLTAARTRGAQAF